MTAIRHPVWLVRHAPTAWTGRRWCGRADPPLSRTGRACALALATELALELPPDTAIWSSPARRARATARAIADAASTPAGEMAVIEELCEVDVGRVEGLTWEELLVREPETAATLEEGGFLDWPGGESAAEVADRAEALAGRILEAATGRPLVVVSHGAILHAVVRSLGGPGNASPVPLGPGGILRLAPSRAA